MCKKALRQIPLLNYSPFLIERVQPRLRGIDSSKVPSVPLQKVSAHVQIYGGIGKLNLVHEYMNKRDDTIECRFTFPVHKEMAVCSLTIVTDGREMEAKIVPKEKAREKYEDALGSGDSAYLLHYDSDQQDLLTMNIGNLKSGTSVTVKLGILMKLEVVDKSWTLILSPTFTPRFANKSDGRAYQDEQLHSLLSMPALPGSTLSYSWEVEVDIVATGSIERLVCLSHKIEPTIGQNKNTAHLAMNRPEPPDQDFILLYRSQDISEPKIFVQESPIYKDEKAAMVSFFPDFCPRASAKSAQLSQENKSQFEESKTGVDSNQDKAYEDEDEQDLLQGTGQFIFMIDRSGSMAGRKMKMAVEAAQLFLQSLPRGSHFNVTSFGSKYITLFQSVVDYNRVNLDKAIKSIRKFKADMGGTQIYNPLQYCYNYQIDSSVPVNIFLLTDGAVSQPDAVVNLVEQNVKFARCHTFGIGNDASQDLVKRVALAGKGTYQFVDSSDQNMNSKVIASLSKAVKPGLTNFKVISEDVYLQGPSNLPNVFHNEPFLVSAIFKKRKTEIRKMEIEAVQTKQGNKVHFDLNLAEALILPPGQEIFQLCTRLALVEMEQQEKRYNQAETTYSLKYRVLGQETAMIAVQKLTHKVEGQTKPIIIPIALKKQPPKFIDSANLASPKGGIRQLNMMPAPLYSNQNSAPLSKERSSTSSIFRGSKYPKSPLQSSYNKNHTLKSFKSAAKQLYQPVAYPSSSSVTNANYHKKQSLSGQRDYRLSYSSYRSSQNLDSRLQELVMPQFFNKHTFSSKLEVQKPEIQMERAGEKKQSREQSKSRMKKAIVSVVPKISMSLIVYSQNIDGCWKLSDILRDMLKRIDKTVQVSPPQIFAVELKQGDRMTAWNTVIALWLLQTFCSKERNEWKRIAAKGNKWLREKGIVYKEVSCLI